MSVYCQANVRQLSAFCFFHPGRKRIPSCPEIKHALLDLLDGHDEEAADDGQCDGRREREVVAEVDHDGGHDDRAAHLAEGGGHVQDAQILAGLFLVRQHVHQQRLVDGGVDGVAEACDAGEQVHAHGGLEDPRHGDADGEEHGSDDDRDLAAADEIGDRAGDEGANQGHDHHDHGHDGHGDGGFLDGLADVVLDDVELVDVDHLVGHEHAEAAGERLVEVMRGGELRRAEGGEDVLGGAFVLRQEVCGLLLRDDDHGDHATEEHEHAGDGEARNQVFDEQCAEHGADRSADGGAGAVEGGHGATDLGRHAVGQDGDHRRDHAVQTEHAGAVEDGQQHGVMRGAGQEQGDATEHRTENDPRSTTTEPGAGTIGEVAEHQVRNQGRHCGERIDDTDEGVRIGAFDGLVVHRQQHGGDDAEA